jgi:hypothetical protein
MMAQSVSYVSAAKLVSMVRRNHCLSIIDVRYARAPPPVKCSGWRRFGD